MTTIRQSTRRRRIARGPRPIRVMTPSSQHPGTRGGGRSTEKMTGGTEDASGFGGHKIREIIKTEGMTRDGTGGTPGTARRTRRKIVNSREGTGSGLIQGVGETEPRDGAAGKVR